jgi:hypothetical protein
MAKKQTIAALDKGTIWVNRETLSFHPLRGVTEMAYLKSMEECIRLYRESIAQPERFWRQLAEDFRWVERWDTMLLDALVNGEHQWFSYAGPNSCQDASACQLKFWRKKEAAATLPRFELRIFVFATLTMLFWLLAGVFSGALSYEGTAPNVCRLWVWRLRPSPGSAECNGWKRSFGDKALRGPAVAVTPHAIIRPG